MIKKILINILLVIVIIALLDLVIGKILRHFYFTETSGLHYRTTYSIDSTKAEIIVLGSSSANHHYVPEIFEDSMKMSFYNTGRDGRPILYNLAIFEAIMKRYTPKIIIVDLNNKNLYYSSKSYDRLSCLQPYYYNHPELQSIVNLRGPYEKYKLLSYIYPYNSSILAIIIGNLEKNKARKGDRKGYVPLFNCMQDSTLIRLDEDLGEFDTRNINALKYIGSTCKAKKIRLVFVQSPIYAIMASPGSSQIFKRIAEQNNAVFINYLNDSLFINNPALFSDRSHLNDEGAKTFSRLIVHQIKN